MMLPRRSGILMHPTSLPGRYGVGDVGDAAYKFVDFLSESGQSYWQVLPITPTGYADSPYQGLSAFAGNPMLISPDKLVEFGHLAQSDLERPPAFDEDRVEFGSVIRYKTGLLDQAFTNFKSRILSSEGEEYKSFCEEQAFWLDDFALYMAIKESFNLAPWYEWDVGIAQRQADAIAGVRESMADCIENQKYRQWQFFKQWLELKHYANRQGIQIIGDIPIFVSMDSSDTWASPHLFQLDDDLKPRVVSGVPPDHFSETGQLWGHPLYRWDVMNKDWYAWWISRFKVTLSQVDIIRIDHFRGFYNYWEIPAAAETAATGNWVLGPGAGLFRAVIAVLGEVPLIAEDLGDFDEKSRAGVDALLDEFGYPGTKVLQFAFNSDASDAFLPHNFTENCVVYTGTHDNDTVKGWYEVSSTDAARNHARMYMGVDGSDIVWDLIRLAWASVANTAITPVQNLVGLGHSARMNTPGTIGTPNWCWRLRQGALTQKISDRLRELTSVYGRLP